MSNQTKIFVNLPVKNLDQSVAFFTKLGFHFNPKFTDKNATCMIIGDDNFVMLLVEEFFKTFTKKPISDAAKEIEVIIALGVASKAGVDDIVNKALAAGAKAANETSDQGFMYTRSFHDLDNHMWEIFYMDPSGAA